MRYSLIIKRLKKSPATFNELLDFLSSESELQSYDLIVSKRTFQRDLDDIRSLFNMDIQYDFSRKVYWITEEQEPELNDRILEAFDTFNALNVVDRLSSYIHFDSRKPQGTGHLNGILHAIRNRRMIEVEYQKFEDEESALKLVEPLALKEFRQRWYVLARDVQDDHIKTLALDRILQLEITKKKFNYPVHFHINEYFRYCFGVIRSKEKEPEEIILSFDPLQGKYIKTLPLHETQDILLDTEKELRISLKLFITDDLVMELMSYGDLVKVLQPQRLIEALKKWHEEAAEQYAKDIAN